MENEELKQLVREFFRILDIVEESDSGRLFHPTNITSCRAMDGARMNDILRRMKEIVGEK